MSVAPDLLLQVTPDIKARQTPARAPARHEQPSNDAPSSFARVYEREREAAPAARKEAAARPTDESRDEPVDESSANAECGEAGVAVAGSGKPLPAELVSEEEAQAAPPSEDPLLLLGLGQNVDVAATPGEGLSEGAELSLESAPLLTAGATQAVSVATTLSSSASLNSAAPASLTLASHDPQIDALNSLADVQLDLQGEAGKSTGNSAGQNAATPAVASQPAALFAQAMARLQGQGEGAALEGESGEAGVLDLGADTLEVASERKADSLPESFAGKLNMLAQAITQQTGRTASALVPGQAVALHAGGMSEAVVDRVMWLSSQNLKSAEIQLDPAELGRLEVRINLQSDQAQVTFASPHASVRDALEGQLHRLRELFAQQGMGQLDVNVSDQSLNRGWQGQQAEEQGRGSGRQSDDDGLGSEPLVTQGHLDIRSRLAGGAPGLVDFYA